MLLPFSSSSVYKFLLPLLGQNAATCPALPHVQHVMLSPLPLFAFATTWILTSSCHHKYATSMCFNLPIPCLWRMCSVAFASMANTGFIYATNAACSSASALILAMIFCIRVYAFRVSLPSSITIALDDFRVSQRPAQSESENVVTYSTTPPFLKICHLIAPTFQIYDWHLQLGKALLREVRHPLTLLGMVSTWILQADCSATRHEHKDLPTSQHIAIDCCTSSTCSSAVLACSNVMVCLWSTTC